MKVSKKNLWVRAASLVTDERPKSLCSLFWLGLIGMSLFPLVIIYYPITWVIERVSEEPIPKVLIPIFSVILPILAWVSTFGTEDQFTIFSLSSLYVPIAAIYLISLMMAALGALILLIVIVVVFIGQILPKKKFREPKVPSIVKRFLKSRVKEKVCPIIEYDD